MRGKSRSFGERPKSEIAQRTEDISREKREGERALVVVLGGRMGGALRSGKGSGEILVRNSPMGGRGQTKNSS